MKARKIIGIILFILGVIGYFFSDYIQKQVEEGKIKIAQAEKTVEQGNKIFSLNPVTKEIGKGLSKPAEKKIAQGKEDVQYYEGISSWLKIGGIIAGIVGIVLFFFSFGKKKRNAT